jgi:transcriptional regulator with GAF, ATPase, and Fis domain
MTERVDNAPDLRTLCAALNSLRDLLPFDLAAVYARAGSADRLVPCAAEGPRASDEVRSRTLSLGNESRLAEAMQRSSPSVLPDDPGRLVVPLFAGGESVGVIVLERDGVEPYTEAELRLAATIGKFAAAAIMPPASSLPDFGDMQRAYFRRVLERTRGRIYGRRGAAELVGLKPTTLQSRLKKLGIDPAPLRRH